MDDLIVLLLFILVPLISGAVTGLFFFKFKLHKRKLSWSRLLVGNVLVLLFAVSMALLLGELYYRFLYDTTDSFGLTKTTTRWFQRHSRPNNWGYRDSISYARAARPGQRRITFVGDSFTAGHGVNDVEDRFANRIRHRFQGTEVHVIAQPGWDTSHELEILRGLKANGYQFDTVVLVYCLNDLSDIVPQWQEILDRIYESYEPGYLFQHSYLLNVCYFRWIAARDPDVANYYGFVLQNYDGPVWRQQQERLKEMRELVESGGGRFFVVIFPFLHSLGPDYPCRDIHRRLDEYFTALGVPHLDLLDMFDSYRSDRLVVNRNDAHPNAFAHQLVADAIAGFLEQQRALTPD